MRQVSEDRLQAMAREHAGQLAAVERLHQGELDRQRELANQALAARDRQHQTQLEESKALHRSQLAAYNRIEQQGGTLHSLANEVQASVESLGMLREKMEKELWKVEIHLEPA